MTLRSQGWCVLTWGVPPEDLMEPIKDAIRRQQPRVPDGSPHVSFFRDRLDGFDAFADYSSSEYSNTEYVYRILLGATTLENTRPEPTIVVRWGSSNERRPYLVGPLDHTPGEALVLLRPIRCQLYLSVYSGSHGFSSDASLARQMDDREASLVTVQENEIILLATRLRFDIVSPADFVAKVFALKIPEPPPGDDATEEYQLERKYVVPFMRRWTGKLRGFESHEI